MESKQYLKLADSLEERVQLGEISQNIADSIHINIIKMLRETENAQQELENKLEKCKKALDMGVCTEKEYNCAIQKAQIEFENRNIPTFENVEEFIKSEKARLKKEEESRWINVSIIQWKRKGEQMHPTEFSFKLKNNIIESKDFESSVSNRITSKLYELETAHKELVNDLNKNRLSKFKLIRRGKLSVKINGHFVQSSMSSSLETEQILSWNPEKVNNFKTELLWLLKQSKILLDGNIVPLPTVEQETAKAEEKKKRRKKKKK